MADGYHYPKTFGGQPKPVAVFGVTSGWYPPLEGCMSQCGLGLQVNSYSRLRRTTPSGTYVGAIGWPVDVGFNETLVFCSIIQGRGFGSSLPPTVITILTSLRGGLPGAPTFWGVATPVKIVTWLILPVVICLSQRLSHACLSISNYTVKLRMAH